MSVTADMLKAKVGEKLYLSLTKDTVQTATAIADSCIKTARIAITAELSACGADYNAANETQNEAILLYSVAMLYNFKGLKDSDNTKTEALSLIKRVYGVSDLKSNISGAVAQADDTTDEEYERKVNSWFS